MMILADIHTHSIASGHSTKDTIIDMARHAANNHLALLGISDHGPGTIGAAKSSYYRSLASAPRNRFGIELLYGVELNILDRKGKVDLDASILSKLDYAIASMHRKNLAPGTKEENTYGYIEVMKNPFVKIIGHCDDVAYPLDYEVLVEAAKDYHVLLELNDSSLAPNGYRGDTKENDCTLIRLLVKNHLPILLSSDSHGKGGIGKMEYALALLKELGISGEYILNNNVEELKKWIL